MSRHLRVKAAKQAVTTELSPPGHLDRAGVFSKASAEVVTTISRRRFVAHQPNLHNMLVLAQGVEP